MSLPTMTGVGRLTDDPEMRYAATGTAVCKVRLAFSSRKKTESGDWIDGDVFFVDGSLFNKEAEHVAESLTKGTEVVVTGRLKTRRYTAKDGTNRSVVELAIDSIGPTLRWHTVSVNKLDRSNGQLDDPWAKSTADVGGGFDEEPPF